MQSSVFWEIASAITVAIEEAARSKPDDSVTIAKIAGLLDSARKIAVDAAMYEDEATI